MNNNIINIVESIEKEKDINKIKLLKEEFNDLVDKHIYELQKNEEMNNINFGNIKKIYENISPKLFSTDKGRKLIHKYIKCITENKTLLNLYILYENFINLSGNKVKSFITESLSLYDFDKKSYNIGIDNLRNILKESLKYTNGRDIDLNDIINEKDKELNECINYITTNKKTLKNLPIFEDKIDRIFNILTEIKSTKETNNDEYISDINENKNINLVTKKNIFEEYKNICINIIDKLLIKSDDTHSKKLNEVKNKLVDKNFNEDLIDNDLLHLIELKNTLLKYE